MAILTNQTTSFAVTGIREDLTDILSIITPIDAHFYENCGTGDTPTQQYHEWQTDTIDSPAANSAVEGDQLGTLVALVATTRLGNYVQIQKKEFAISRTMEKTKVAGRKNELAHQTMKQTRALTGDIEKQFLSGVWSTTASGAGDTTHARLLRGALNWVTTNLSKAADATLNSDGTVTGGTARPLDEDLLKDTLQNIFVAGGDPKIAYLGPWQKRQISTFQNTQNYRKLVDGKKLEAAIDVYVSDFYTLALKPHRGMPTDVVFIPDMNFWKKATFDPVQRVEVPSTVDGKVYRIIVEHTLEARNEAASGRITNLTTS